MMRDPNAAPDNNKSLPGYLIVAPWPVIAQGGVNGVITNLVREMRQDGRFYPLLIEKDWNATRMKWDTSGDCPAARYRLRVPVSINRNGSDTIKTLTFLSTLPTTVARLYRVIRNNRVRYINIHYPGLSSAVFFWLKRTGLFRGNLILSLHNSDVRDSFAAQGAALRHWHRILRKADLIIVVSDELRKEVLRNLPGLRTPIRVAYNGVDVATFQGQDKPDVCHDRDPSIEPVVLSVASFQLRKGLDVLLDAFHLVRSHDSRARLVVAGQTAEDFDDLKAQTTRLDLDDRVHWEADVPYAQIPRMLRRADVFVLASRNEGFPLALLEAGAAGLPVIATRVGGVPEIITEGETGLLVPPGDPEALAGALTHMLENPQEAARMGDNLQRLIKEEFSWQAMYRQYAALLD